MKAMLRTAVLAGAFLFTACAGFSDRSVQQDAQREARLQEIRELLAALAESNRGLERFKGTGRFRIRQADKMQTWRVAWVGSYPDKLKLRIAVPNPVSQPVAIMATDGIFFYMFVQGEFYKKRATNPTLQKLVSIPISVHDIIAILTGRLPVREHDLAELTADENSPGYILTLKSRWRGVLERIYLDSRKQAVSKIEMFGFSGDLLYRADFHGRKQVDGYLLPEKVIVSDAEESRFELDMESYSTEVSVEPSTFVVSPPESKD